MGWLSPGRTIRVPVGWLLLAAAGCATFLAVSYTVGYLRGEVEAQAEYEQSWLASDEAAWKIPPPEPPPEPTEQGPPGTADALSPTDAAAPAPPPAPAPPQDEPESSYVIEPGGPTPDPREDGVNYFVLIHTKRENAIRLAAFCREHGVDAFAIRANNLNLYKVVVLPGYRARERDAEDVRALERHIKDVAQRWKLQVNPRDDLAYYPEKYTP